jgi:hypothetical protein
VVIALDSEDKLKMTNTFRSLLAFIGALLFAIGVLLGQQGQRSKFDKYMRPASVTPMDIAALKANLGVVRSFMSLEVPTIDYDPACQCFLAHASVTSELTKEPIDKVRVKLMGIAATTRRALAFEFPELSKPGTVPDRDFKMTFFELNIQNPNASHDVAAYVDGKIVFK